MDERAITRSTDEILTEVDTGTKLAVDRTRLAYERTMMAWLRTATSLISFGFTIQKFFQIENQGSPRSHGVLGPGNFGRLMVLAGLVVLVLSTLDHRREMVVLKKQYPAISIKRSMATWLSAVIATLGILAMISVMIRS
jgi:putative membrane protein